MNTPNPQEGDAEGRLMSEDARRTVVEGDPGRHLPTMSSSNEVGKEDPGKGGAGQEEEEDPPKKIGTCEAGKTGTETPGDGGGKDPRMI